MGRRQRQFPLEKVVKNIFAFSPSLFRETAVPREDSPTVSHGANSRRLSVPDFEHFCFQPSVSTFRNPFFTFFHFFF